MASGGSYTKINGEWVPTQQAANKTKEVKPDESTKKSPAGRN